MHYVCTGGCGGVSDKPGVCQTKTCPLHQHTLKECDCSDNKHSLAFGHYNIKLLPFEKLEGISQKTLEIHHGKLYAGYVNKLNEIRDKIAAANKLNANATYSEVGEFKRQETFALNGVILHERYFKCLGGDGKPQGDIIERIKKDFGSYKDWQVDFTAAGLAARGWTILAWDYNNGRLHNYSADLHNQGGVWGCAPIIVLDVYEHAYFIDFGSDRKSYLEIFFKNLNWLKVDEMFRKLTK